MMLESITAVNHQTKVGGAWEGRKKEAKRIEHAHKERMSEGVQVWDCWRGGQ